MPAVRSPLRSLHSFEVTNAVAELVWLVEFRTLKPSSSDNVADAIHLQGDLADGCGDLRRCFAARSVGRLDRDDQVALVLDSE